MNYIDEYIDRQRQLKILMGWKNFEPISKITHELRLAGTAPIQVSILVDIESRALRGQMRLSIATGVNAQLVKLLSTGIEYRLNQMKPDYFWEFAPPNLGEQITIFTDVIWDDKRLISQRVADLVMYNKILNTAIHEAQKAFSREFKI